MRFLPLSLAAAALLAFAASILTAADPTASATPDTTPAGENAPTSNTAAAPASSTETATPTAETPESGDPATPPPAATENAREQPAAAESTAPQEAPAPVASTTEETAPTQPQVVMARIDPELALRLSLLEKTLLAQAHGQNAIYTETSRLLMYFGTACVAMGLIAMVAAVFLMNRTLASVSAITAQVAQAQVAHAQVPPALPGPAGIIPAAPTTATGFEKVQASGHRFQSRMTSLEQRLEELENLAGQGAAAAAAGDEVAVGPAPAVEPPPRRRIPLAAILVHKAEALMNLGKLNEAMTVLDEAARHEGDPSEVHLARGRVLEKLGRLGDALQSYDLAVTSDEKNTAALLMKAGVLNRQERFDEALSCYERALAVHRANN